MKAIMTNYITPKQNNSLQNLKTKKLKPLKQNQHVRQNLKAFKTKKQKLEEMYEKNKNVKIALLN
jgi:hypothetical protein